jgi:hypothetical protein
MTTQWANIGEDQGALHALVQRIVEHVPVRLIDYVWIFPARRIAIGESTVVVIGAFGENGDRRRVINARFDEHGSAPSNAVPRIVDGVLRRLGEDADAPPREEQVGGSQEQWDALIVALGGRPPAAETVDATALDAAPSADSSAPSDPLSRQ